MSQPTYTAIPDTSDNNYWATKSEPGNVRSTTFVPRDKELHQQLKIKAWAIIQASLRKSNRKVSY
ncbi:hypothetical protein [Spirosoma foliorum]|uniref:Uncharacterized protein n=1 Tax=Spirosoma foliorum TaxID=2710596 RepID=A0A7G5H1J9_9BACT|nr:hypothetical protein [Spirosoma foliorum]QMW04991.1 hypothetical protein H3H32_08895 [Spirosoma foliorum]